MNSGEVSTKTDGSEMLRSILKQWLRWINIPGKEGPYQLIRWIPAKLLPFSPCCWQPRTHSVRSGTSLRNGRRPFSHFFRGFFLFLVRGSLKIRSKQIRWWVLETWIHDNQDLFPLNFHEFFLGFFPHWAWPPGTLGYLVPCWCRSRPKLLKLAMCQPKMELICCILSWNLETLKPRTALKWILNEMM